MTMLLGQKIALPVFIAIYLVRWGNYSKRIALLYATCVWAIMVFFYGQVMSILFHPSWLETSLRGVLPASRTRMTPSTALEMSIGSLTGMTGALSTMAIS